MFNFVGWLIVTSFALYGLAKFLREHVILDKHKTV